MGGLLLTDLERPAFGSSRGFGFEGESGRGEESVDEPPGERTWTGSR
jgi:hypothetical protein